MRCGLKPCAARKNIFCAHGAWVAPVAGKAANYWAASRKDAGQLGETRGRVKPVQAGVAGIKWCIGAGHAKFARRSLSYAGRKKSQTANGSAFVKACYGLKTLPSLAASWGPLPSTTCFTASQRSATWPFWACCWLATAWLQKTV